MVSVIILTRDRKARLAKALAALAPQTAPCDEVIIIDTGSTDGTVEWLSDDPPPQVRLLRSGGVGSWAEARNLGLREARGGFIAYLDDDCYPAPDWMERGRSALDRADAAGGLVIPHAVATWPDWWDPRMGWLVGYSVPGHEGPEAGRYFYPYTSNLWLRAGLGRAEPFQELGGSFSAGEKERYALGREDAEWWRRVRVRGWRTLFDPRMRVEHDIDTGRLDWNYLSARARLDGEAWARREGSASDLEPLAYQLLQLVHTRRNGADARVAGLDRIRASAAFRALSGKIAAERGPGVSHLRAGFEPKLRAHLRFLRDRAKDAARRIVLAASPPRSAGWPAEPPRRVAVAALGYVGDLVILQGCLRGLLERDPGLQLHLAAPPAGAFIFRGMERLHMTTLPAPGGPRGEARLALGRWLDEARPELVLAPYLHGTQGSVLVRLLHAAKWGAPLASFSNDQGLLREIDRLRVPLSIAKDLTIHESDNIARLFESAHLQAASIQPRIEPGEPGRAAAARLLHEWFGAPDGTLVLVINPHAGQPFKEWTPEAWAACVSNLARDAGRRFVINLSRPDPALEACMARSGVDSKRIGWLRGAPLETLAALMAASTGIITVDSAPQHLAHALGVRSLTLYGPMDERRWSGRWDPGMHITIRGGMFDLTPEELRGLPSNHIMRLIDPARAAGAAADHFKPWPRPGSAQSRADRGAQLVE